MITVYYYYRHKDGSVTTEEIEFNCWQKALRFIKKVDGPKFTGHVKRWECLDPYDNEQLWVRHRITPYVL